jgi:hypothetical protein
MSSSNTIRWSGLAAMFGGIIGIIYFPFHALSWFATDGAEALEKSWVAAWVGAVKPILEPVLTFASPDTVYLTYGKLVLLVVLGFLAGTLGLHTRQAGRGGRLEKWGFRVTLVGTVLLILGALVIYWVGYVDFGFIAFAVPGFLTLMFGSTLFGIGTLRAKVAPRLGAWLLTFGGFPGIIVMSELIGHLSGGLLLLYLAWIIIGYSLWSDRYVTATHQQPATI